MDIKKITLIILAILVLNLTTLAMLILLEPAIEPSKSITITNPRTPSSSTITLSENKDTSWKTTIIDECNVDCDFDIDTHWKEINQRKEASNKFYMIRAERYREQGEEKAIYN